MLHIAAASTSAAAASAIRCISTSSSPPPPPPPSSIRLPTSAAADCLAPYASSLPLQQQKLSPPPQLLRRPPKLFSELPPPPPSADPVVSFFSSVLDTLERLLITPFEHPLPASSDPSVQLSGNFFPVPEYVHPSSSPHPLPVDGAIPPSLDGVYVRNGANPAFLPSSAHHLFDGDGMLHAVRFSGGAAAGYSNRFTLTHRLRQELRHGRPIFPKSIGELHGHTGVARLLLFLARQLLGLADASHGMGVANAGLVFFNGRLLAMSEDDLPYAVHVTDSGDLHTLGRYDFAGQLASSMIAHPKLDPRTGELLALSYDVVKKPYLKYFKFSPDGTKGPDVAVTVKEPTMVHDFAITENYVVIPDQQVVFRLPEMLRGGSPVVRDGKKVARFGVLPRDDGDERRIVWVDVPECFCLHLWNAWEEEEDNKDEVVVIGSCMTPADGIFNDGAAQPIRSVLSEIRLNLRTRSAKVTPLVSDINLEAGQVNRQWLGRKSRFAYLAIADPWPKVSGIAKVDLTRSGAPRAEAQGRSRPGQGQSLGHDHDRDFGDPCNNNPLHTSTSRTTNSVVADHLHPPNTNTTTTVTTIQNNVICPGPNSNSSAVCAQFIYPPHCFGGEPMFVPRSPDDPSSPEDDGYILTFLHNEATGSSELLILDAKSPTLEKIASVKLPSRVPYGFHGTFVTSKELKHQKGTC